MHCITKKKKISAGRSDFLKRNKNSFMPGAAIQRKLSIGSANDRYEQEADAMADKVVSMSESGVSTKQQSGALLQRKCAACEEEQSVQMKPLANNITPLIRRKEGAHQGESAASDAVTNRIKQSKGSGNKMDASTRGYMESRFGTDFSSVNIHTGGNAIQLSKELNAQAFTVGNDIYFNQGKYNPASTTGKHLLAHELTHTLQQEGNTRVRRKFQATGEVNDFVAIVNTILGVQYRIVAARNGEISIQTTNAQGPPTRDATELLRVIRMVINSSQTTSIEFIRGDSSRRASDRNVIVGSYALSRVDLDDVEAFGYVSSHSEMGDNAAVQLVHEITEQYRKQVHGESFRVAHQAGYRAQERVLGARLIHETPMTPIGSNQGEVTTTYRYPSGREVDVVTRMNFTNGQIISVRRKVRP